MSVNTAEETDGGANPEEGTRKRQWNREAVYSGLAFAIGLIAVLLAKPHLEGVLGGPNDQLLGPATLPPLNTAVPCPDPSRDPEETIALLLDALRNNDSPFPDAGLRTVENFLSPSTRRAARVWQLLRGEEWGLYEILVGHAKVEPSEIRELEEGVGQCVLVTHPRLGTRGFMFYLTQSQASDGDVSWRIADIVPDFNTMLWTQPAPSLPAWPASTATPPPVKFRDDVHNPPSQ